MFSFDYRQTRGLRQSEKEVGLFEAFWSLELRLHEIDPTQP